MNASVTYLLVEYSMVLKETYFCILRRRASKAVCTVAEAESEASTFS